MVQQVFTHTRQENYLERIRKGGRRVASARACGIDPSTLYRFLEANPGFREKVDRAEVEATEPVEDRLWEAAVSGEPWAIRDVLKYRGGKRWIDPDKQVQVNVSVSGGVEHTHRLEAVQTLRETLEARAVEVRELTGGDAAPERKEPAP